MRVENLQDLKEFNKMITNTGIDKKELIIAEIEAYKKHKLDIVSKIINAKNKNLDFTEFIHQFYKIEDIFIYLNYEV